MDALKDSNEPQENVNVLDASVENDEGNFVAPSDKEQESSDASKEENQDAQLMAQISEHATLAKERAKNGYVKWCQPNGSSVQSSLFPWSGLALRIFLFFVFASIVSRLAFALEHFQRTRALGSEFLGTIAYWTIPVDVITACVLSIIPISLCFVQLIPRVDPRWLVRCYLFLATGVLALVEMADMVTSRFWGKRLAAEVVVQAQQVWAVMANLSLSLVLSSLGRLAALVVVLLIGLYLLVFRPLARLWPIQKNDLLAATTLWLAISNAGILGFSKVGTGNTAASFSAFQNQNIPFALKLTSNPVHTILGHMMSAMGVHSSMMCRIPEGTSPIPLSAVAPENQGMLSHRMMLRPDVTWPHIVLVVSEAFSSDAIDVLNGHSEGQLSPRFNALAQEGILFTGFHANWMQTKMAVHSLLTGRSLPSFSSTQSAFPEILRTQGGYKTSFFYGGSLSLFGVEGFLEGVGIDTVFWRDNFFQKSPQTAWGAFDSEVFDAAAQMITQDEDTDQMPRFDVILTLTNHLPYAVPEGFVAPQMSPDSPFFQDWTEKEFRAHRYADESFGQFVEKLKASKTWENTLLIFVADHGRHGSAFEAEDERRHRIPMLWLGGALDPSVVGTQVSELGFQADLAATLLGQLNMDTSDFPMSQDMFSPQRLQAGMFVISDNNHFGVVTTEGYDIFSCITGTTMGLGSEAIQKLGWSYVKRVLEERERLESGEATMPQVDFDPSSIEPGSSEIQ